jgi:putative ubiquitin-RnfH superfamily antitoxin RatB of RatAB toxin-antitoxin module
MNANAATSSATIAVTVAYCAVDARWLAPLRVAPGTTLRQAIIDCGVLEKFPELAAGALDVGVFGHRRALDLPLADGDRIEIYRPLQLDPMAARRLRALARLRREVAPTR